MFMPGSSQRARDASEFDTYAANYDAALGRGIAVSGENRVYFAHGRVSWTRSVLSALGVTPRRILDYGCGVGSTAAVFRQTWDVESLVGVDTSSECIRLAGTTDGSPTTRFDVITGYEPSGDRDLVYCNGVFHHIPFDERAAALAYIWACLEPGGFLAFYENNPWNPGTRYVMSRIPFDREAKTLSALEAKRLIRASGFEVVRTDFLFVFPRRLSWLRPLERTLSSLPIGAQYLVLGRKLAVYK